jgi:hypothetical protein
MKVPVATVKIGGQEIIDVRTYRRLEARHEALCKSMLDFAADVERISNFLAHEPDLQGDLRRSAAAAKLAAQ